jgi:2-keto-4-pentenoate hydratase/2-oxohepta-3-ene-1,7-dioic acid hydratase in catechol pathway
MKLCRFSTDFNERPTAVAGPHIYYGMLEGEAIRVLTGWPSGEHAFTDAVYNPDQVRLLPPCVPSKIVCVGRNYLEHARELDNEVPTEPLIFLKPPSAAITAGYDIVYPPQSQRVDHEGEIGVVIRRRCRRLAADEDVTPYIFGYTCVNDITARDLQKKDGQWTRAKGFDTFCSFGPVIATDADPTQLEVRTSVNGELRQRGHASQMIFPIDVVVRFISQVMTLEPGDLIATGTPAGIGPMKPGDTVEVAIEGIGVLRNTVVAV